MGAERLSGLADCGEYEILSATEDFDKQLAGLVNAERRAIYGHPADNFRRIAAIDAIIAECPDPVVRVALSAIGTKLCRLVQTPDHLDSFIDIAGYARCGVMILDRRAEEKPSV